jgi:hypothetical protein
VTFTDLSDRFSSDFYTLLGYSYPRLQGRAAPLDGYVLQGIRYLPARRGRLLHEGSEDLLELGQQRHHRVLAMLLGHRLQGRQERMHEGVEVAFHF